MEADMRKNGLKYKSLNSYTVIYYENGEIREETVIDAECNIWEIGRKYFPAFDFCNNG